MTGPLLIVVGQLGWHVGWLTAALIVLAFEGLPRAVPAPRAEQRKLPIASALTPARRRSLVALALAFAVVAVIEWRWPWLRSFRDGIAGAVADVPFFGALSLEAWIALAFLSIVTACIALLGRMRRWLAGRESAYARGFVTLLEQPGIDRALAFIVLFALGDALHEDAHAVPAEGVRHGHRHVRLHQRHARMERHARRDPRGWLAHRAQRPEALDVDFILAQNIPNLLYAWAASSNPGSAGNVVLGAVVLVEDFGAGLGTGFIVYLMRCVDPRHKATHMAVLTAIMSLGFTLAGVASGFIADAVGYPILFALTFVATVPSMVMVRWVPYLDCTRAEEVASDSPGRRRLTACRARGRRGLPALQRPRPALAGPSTPPRQPIAEN